MITVSDDYKEPVSPRSSLSDFPQKTAPFTEFKNCLHGYNASLNCEMEVHEASSSSHSTVKHDSKIPQKIKSSAIDSSKCPKRKYNIITPAFPTWNAVPHSLKQSSIPVLHGDDSLKFHYQWKIFISNLNWPSSIWFQHRIIFNYIQINRMVSKSCARQNNELHMSTGLKIIKNSSLCKWISYDLLYLIYLLMIRIRNSTLRIKNVSIMRHTNAFGKIFLTTSQKKPTPN